MKFYVDTTTITVGPSRVGKSYSQGACFSLYYIFQTPRKLFFTNISLNVAEIEAYAIEHKLAREVSVRDRIFVIPERELLSWRDGRSGPWNYLAVTGQRGFRWVGEDFPQLVKQARFEHVWHLTLDEAHELVGRFAPIKMLGNRDLTMTQMYQWMMFIQHGVGHNNGSSINLITQDLENLEPWVRAGIQTLRSLCKSDQLYLWRVRLSDWYKLITSLTGWTFNFVYEFEYTNRNGKKVAVGSRCWRLNPEIFKLFNSHSAGMGREQQQVNKDDKVSPWFIVDFLSDHMFKFAWFILIVLVSVLGLHFLLSGGLFQITRSMFPKAVASSVHSVPSRLSVDRLSSASLARVTPVVTDSVDRPMRLAAVDSTHSLLVTSRSLERVTTESLATSAVVDRVAVTSGSFFSSPSLPASVTVAPLAAGVLLPAAFAPKGFYDPGNSSASGLPVASADAPAADGSGSGSGSAAFPAVSPSGFSGGFLGGAGGPVQPADPGLELVQLVGDGATSQTKVVPVATLTPRPVVRSAVRLWDAYL